uniref:Chitobiosyldiphosphodolichol beta-mannosyltransferase-like n=2 Tax=Hirondellea gigas TaxID=1518452 RepID=A0A2P2I6I8_9CRUS
MSSNELSGAGNCCEDVHESPDHATDDSQETSSDVSCKEQISSISHGRVNVVVLGDIGHSPRMTYHSLSLAKEGYSVNLFGYSNSKPQEELLSHPNINIIALKQTPKQLNKLPMLLRFVMRVLWQALTLWVSLLAAKRPKTLLLQNPPCVPALPVCWLYCLLFRVRLILDWHNYGYSILALTLGERHPLVSIYKTVEKIFGKLASAGLCVSRAMKDDLKKKWGIKNVTVHYDRPPTRFHPISIEDKHNLFLKLTPQLPCLAGSAPDKTVFTERFADGRVCYFEDRPALLISSTSWTEDEDFSILLRALTAYEQRALSTPTEYPRLIVIVTGKGPLKDYYLEQTRLCAWQMVQLETVWLDPEDYPRLLAAADIGLSLHTSSSGLDLPMKVVDMFGCGLPVIAQYYPTLEELVKPNINGIIFKSWDELADRLMSWFKGFPQSESHQVRCERFHRNLDNFRQLQWHDYWQCNVLPLISQEAAVLPAPLEPQNEADEHQS